MMSIASLHSIVEDTLQRIGVEYNADPRVNEDMPEFLRQKIEKMVWREICVSSFRENNCSLVSMQETARNVSKHVLSNYLRKRYRRKTTFQVDTCNLM
jgi:hypothetical protein